MTQTAPTPPTQAHHTATRSIAIIGGGAAGLIAAITAARRGATVTLFESSDKVGKKILASGNGRCNISNTTLSPADYFGTDPAFVTTALNQFGFAAFQKFCHSIGLLIQTKEDGRAYPLSNTAGSVVTALLTSAQHLKVQFHYQVSIDRITQEGNAFTLHYGDQYFGDFDCVLIATGSEAAPQLGANNSGYTLAHTFKHSLHPPYPSLVALELNSPFHSKMSGMKQEAEVTLYINYQAEQTLRGDILFTRYGISGFAILDISQKASEALTQYAHVTIGLKLLPEYDRQHLSDQIITLCQQVPAHTIHTVLGGLIAPKIAMQLLLSCQIDPTAPASTLSTKVVKKIANALCDWRFEVSDTHGFQHAEVSGGGVDTSDINAHTMASQKVSGLYFAGEVLDIVGRRGGYNLHFAWASGYLAGMSMAKA